jgi:hypothetical protein
MKVIRGSLAALALAVCVCLSGGAEAGPRWAGRTQLLSLLHPVVIQHKEIINAQ